MIDISDEEFRVSGKTGAARNYPLTERACQWIAKFNGIDYGKMPRSWRYASNPYMQEYIERRAEEDDSLR